MSGILDIGVSRQTVNKAEVMLGMAVCANSHRWYGEQYGIQAAVGSEMAAGCWDVHSLRSDVPSVSDNSCDFHAALAPG